MLDWESPDFRGLSLWTSCRTEDCGWSLTMRSFARVNGRFGFYIPAIDICQSSSAPLLTLWRNSTRRGPSDTLSGRQKTLCRCVQIWCGVGSSKLGWLRAVFKVGVVSCQWNGRNRISAILNCCESGILMLLECGLLLSGVRCAGCRETLAMGRRLVNISRN